MAVNTLSYTGVVQGKMVPNRSGDGTHFEGAIGELDTWLWGKAAEQAERYMGQTVLATGLLNSRASDKGNHFISPVIFGLLPASDKHSHNLVAFDGVIAGVRRIKEGLYNMDVEIDATTWNREKRQREAVKMILPVATGAVTESDIGSNVSVVGSLRVRNGKFIDVNPEQVTVERDDALGDLLGGDGDAADADLDDLL